MSRNVPINIEIENKKESCIDTKIPDQYPINIELGTASPGNIPRGGLPGQVLTKTNKAYKWENNPIQVSTYEDLPENPSTHCLYFIKDTCRLVYWQDSQWIYINTDSELLYDDEEEMIYIAEKVIY